MIRISGKRTLDTFKWEDFVPTDEWVEKNVYLNSDVSAITGYMQLKYTPHLREMMKDYDLTTSWKFTAMFSSQCGKTTSMFALIAKALDTDPTNMQLAIPADNGVQDYIIGKVDPFFNGIKSLKRKFDQFTETEKKRTVSARKRVAGGNLFITGSSAKERRSRTVKYLFLDEVSLFPVGAVTEFIGRTKSYEKFFRKVFLVSTIKDAEDEIVRSYNDSECKKEWEIQCPSCSEYFHPTSKHFRYVTEADYKKKFELTEDDFDIDKYKSYAKKQKAFVECPHCSYNISTEEKDSQILSEKCRFNIVDGSNTDGTIGYKANALAMYSTKYETIANLLIDAENFEQKSIIYVDYFNEIYSDGESKVKMDDILLLGNGYYTWEIPDDTVRLYMTIDTQKDHFYWKITAYTFGFVANTVAFGRAETTHDLKMLMFNTYNGKNGRVYRIDKVAIDRRGIAERTTQVDEFIIEIMEETGEIDFIYATQGVGEITGGRMFTINRIKKKLDGVEYEFKAINISNIMAKNELSNMISRAIANKVEDKEYTKRLFAINEDIVENAKDRGGKSTIHDYERHMTSEEIRTEKGKQVWEKKNSSVRNDYWDCSVQGVVLAEMELVGNMRKPEVNDAENGDKLLSLFG